MAITIKLSNRVPSVKTGVNGGGIYKGMPIIETCRDQNEDIEFWISRSLDIWII